LLTKRGEKRGGREGRKLLKVNSVRSTIDLWHVQKLAFFFLSVSRIQGEMGMLEI